MDLTVLGTHSPEDCGRVSRVLARVGDKWSVLIVILLRTGPRRFNDIKRNVSGISQQMLTRVLRGLERDGMLTRTVYPTVPPGRVRFDRARAITWGASPGLGAVGAATHR
ncbi:helix-turn-helix domain-containing protein [Pseudomonas aeruginosa]|uniref:winged helix-turn-helix transcriptional regulator n=1 Tax=Pseudomonas aeruginosa TaxID=287 RepID=UPI003457D160